MTAISQEQADRQTERQTKVKSTREKRKRQTGSRKAFKTMALEHSNHNRSVGVPAWNQELGKASALYRQKLRAKCLVTDYRDAAILLENTQTDKF